MVITYPSTLPQYGQLGYSISPADNLVRNPMSIGPAKRRLRTTSNPRPVSFTLVLTTTQRETLETFHETTLSYGLNEFQAPDFGKVGASNYIYCFSSPPSFKWVGGNVWETELHLLRLRVA